MNSIVASGIKKCAVAKLEDCPEVKVKASTAFLAFCDDCLFTAAHVARELLKDSKNLSDLNSFVVVDVEKKSIVYDSREASIKPVLNSIGAVSEQSFDTPNDYALIKLNKKLDRPFLKTRTEPIRKNETLFIVGYPGAKEKNAEMREDFLVSQGQAVSLWDCKWFKTHQWRRFFWVPILSWEWSDDHVVTTTASIFKGMSGGPITDSQGNVVGIATNENMNRFDEENGEWPEGACSFGPNIQNAILNLSTHP